TVGVTHLDQVPVPTFAAHTRHDPVGGRAHRSPVRRSVVGALVGAPLVENRVEAAAEAARDATELQRRAQERALQRPPAVVVEATPSLAGVGLEPEGEAGTAAHVHARGEDAPEAPLPLGGLQAVEQDLEAIAALD